MCPYLPLPPPPALPLPGAQGCAPLASRHCCVEVTTENGCATTSQQLAASDTSPYKATPLQHCPCTASRPGPPCPLAPPVIWCMAARRSQRSTPRGATSRVACCGSMPRTPRHSPHPDAAAACTQAQAHTCPAAPVHAHTYPYMSMPIHASRMLPCPAAPFPPLNGYNNLPPPCPLSFSNSLFQASCTLLHQLCQFPYP